MLYIRPAKKWESETLTELAFKSESFWKFPEEFMSKFKSIYTITEDFLNNTSTFVLESNGNIIGFYSLINNSGENTLEYFYISPDHIGKGYGKTLWNHLINTCKNKNINDFSFVTSPEAENFYTKLGAEKIDIVESLIIKERKIPKLYFALK